MKSKQAFLINTSYTTWNEPPRSRHQVAYALRKYGDVYFIARNEVGLPKVEVKEIDGIKFIIPYWPIDYRYRYRLPFINELYQKHLYEILLKEKLHKSILVNFDHTSYTLSQKFSRTVYYCSDDHIGNADLNIGLINRYHKFTERKLSQNSIYCVTTAKYLYSKLKKYNSNTYLIPLGAPDIETTNIKFEGRHDEKKIKVCYVGSMQNRRISDEIISSIIKSNDIEFHVIGNVEDKFKKILKDKAVLVGVKEYEILYNYLKEMDVCVIPYDLEGINKGVTPNKYWLYTACGKPSVSVPVANILDWPQENGLLYLSSKSNFIETVRKAYREDSREKFNYRLRYARENTWDKRMKQFMSILEEEF